MDRKKQKEIHALEPIIGAQCQPHALSENMYAHLSDLQSFYKSLSSDNIINTTQSSDSDNVTSYFRCRDVRRTCRSS